MRNEEEDQNRSTGRVVRRKVRLASNEGVVEIE
jgi:hypothetical protein